MSNQSRKYVRPGDACCKCGKYEVEVIDEWVSAYCGYCNDRLVEQANEAREWRDYHSDEGKP